MKFDLNYDVSDVHVHFGQDSILKKTVSAKRLVNYIKSHNLRQILVFSADVRYSHYNKILEDMLQNHNEIYGLVRVGLDYDLKETYRLLENPKFVGVKFHPSLDRTPVTQKGYTPLFSQLEKIGKVALIHCGRWQEVAGYKYMFEIAQKYQDLTIIAAHMGGIELQYCRETILLSESLDNVYLETSNCYLPVVIEEAVQRIGDDRILFGSDFPWGTWLGNVGTIVESEISEKSKRRILGDNFRELLQVHNV